MAYRLEKRSFGHKFGEPFRLETQYLPDTSSAKHRVLFQGMREVKAERLTLDLLALFLEQPNKRIDEMELQDRLWGKNHPSKGNVEQQVYKLRTILGDNAKTARFIRTIPTFGYEFIGEVQTEESSAGYASPHAKTVQTYEHWDHERFIRFVAGTSRGDESDEEGDLRVLTTAFSSGVPDAIPDLLERNVRIKILFVNETLMRARNAVRPEYKRDANKPLRILKEQKDTLETMRERAAKGSLQVEETGVMPCGMIIHSRNGALIGFFLATESYARGPMIEVGRDTKLWEILRADWNELWKDAASKGRSIRRRVS